MPEAMGFADDGGQRRSYLPAPWLFPGAAVGAHSGQAATEGTRALESHRAARGV